VRRQARRPRHRHGTPRPRSAAAAPALRGADREVPGGQERAVAAARRGRSVATQYPGRTWSSPFPTPAGQLSGMGRNPSTVDTAVCDARPERVGEEGSWPGHAWMVRCAAVTPRSLYPRDRVPGPPLLPFWLEQPVAAGFGVHRCTPANSSTGVAEAKHMRARNATRALRPIRRSPLGAYFLVAAGNAVRL
jgi:hypothetical protein